MSELGADTSSNAPWSDAELTAAVEAYVYLLRIEQAGFGYPPVGVTKLLLSQPLNGRNEASLRYRMRNISAVAAELGGPILKAYSPAERVGANVRTRIRTLLLSHQGFKQEIAEYGAAKTSRNAVKAGSLALERLDSLRVQIDEFEHKIIGVGHNRPPEPLHDLALERSDFEEARNSIDAIRTALTSIEPEADKIESSASVLVDFGLKVLSWVAGRATKLADATLSVLAPVVLIEATGLSHHVVDTIKAVMAAILR